MSTYFHDWRPTVGFVTLAMAATMTMIWGRSLCIQDKIAISGSPAQHTIVSADEAFGVLSAPDGRVVLGQKPE